MSKRTDKLISANALREAVESKIYWGGVDLLEAIDEAPNVDAVEIRQLGKLGRLMMPYKGDPRGAMGERGGSGLGLRLETLDPIEDIDGNLWIPVLASDLKRLREPEGERGQWRGVHLRGGFAEEWGYGCSKCGCVVSEKSRLGKYQGANQQLNFCPNCGRPMEGVVW